MLKQTTLLLLIALIACSQNISNKCEYAEYNNAEMLNCANGQQVCEGYNSQAEAEQKCSLDNNCLGISKETGNPNSKFELRKGSLLPNAASYMTWFKKSCNFQYSACYWDLKNQLIEGNCLKDNSNNDSCLIFNSESTAKDACTRNPDCLSYAITGSNQLQLFDSNLSKSPAQGQSSFKNLYTKTVCTEENYRCDYQLQPNFNIQGCLNDDCKEYDSLIDAQRECDKNDQCRGISYENRNEHYAFILKQSEGLIPSGKNFANSWLKKNSCEEQNQQLINQADLLKPYDYYFSAAIPNTQLGACFLGCKDFTYLLEAIIACARHNLRLDQKQENCDGVTFAQKENGGANSTGPLQGWGFQLRRTTIEVISERNEISWKKVYSNFDQLFNVQCYFQNYGYRLSDCINNCFDYADQAEAKLACTQLGKACSGIQFTNSPQVQDGKSKFRGLLKDGFGYVLMKNSEITQSDNSKEIAILKTPCVEYNSRCDWQESRNFSLEDTCYIEGNEELDEITVFDEAQKICDQKSDCKGFTLRQVPGSVDEYFFYSQCSANQSIGKEIQVDTFQKSVCEKQEIDYEWSFATYDAELLVDFEYNGEFIQFDYLEEAIKECEQYIDCGGVTRYILRVDEVTKFAMFTYRLKKSTFTIKVSDQKLRIVSWVRYIKVRKSENRYNCYRLLDSKKTYSQCSNQCISYATIEEAVKQCNQDSNCNGIVEVNKKDQFGHKTNAKNKFQLRTGDLIDVTQDIPIKTYKKTKKLNCNAEIVVGGDIDPGQTEHEGSEKTENVPENTTETTTDPTVIPTPPEEPECPKNCVKYYTDCDFKGDVLTVCQDIPVQRKIIYRSVYVPPGMQTKVYEKTYYNGQEKVITKSISCEEKGLLLLIQLQNEFHSIKVSPVEQYNLKKQN